MSALMPAVIEKKILFCFVCKRMPCLKGWGGISLGALKTKERTIWKVREVGIFAACRHFFFPVHCLCRYFFFLGQVPFTIFLFFWERRTIFSRTQQSFRETAIFWKTKKSFRKQSSLFENATKLSRTLKSFLEHNEIFW